ncbi:MAG: DUF1365 family protein [Rhizobiales bacterium]|nr:DUF1365 family protein [Hyphomicrobiales bacterium]
MTDNASLYFGHVFHRRLRPRKHELAYRVFYMLLDLDRLDETARASRLFGYNQARLFSFYDRDHGPGSDKPLRPWVVAQLARGGIEIGNGKISLLTFPRILGYVFVPLSIYYCHDEAGDLVAILYEVNNTFGDRHSYLIPVAAGAGSRIAHGCDKALYVSPFVEVKGRYHFKMVRPGDHLSVVIRESDAEGALITAAFTGDAKPFNDAQLARAFVSYPLMTLKVTAAIHWQALKLFIKGVKMVVRPAAPASPVSTVPLDRASSVSD